MIKRLLQPVENAPLIVFRILFGIVFLFESIGSIASGWVRSVYVKPTTHFSFIGFEWLAFLSTDWVIYTLFVLMAVFSLLVTIGYKYRMSVVGLFIVWGMVYLGQKTFYNNHYYLMWLITMVLFFVPSNAYASVDAKKNPAIRSKSCPRWCVWIFMVLITIVYFFATVAKFYPDWLDGTVTTNIFRGMKRPEFLVPLFKLKYFPIVIAYLGILFDGLIVPALLWKRTRWLAVVASLIFHIFNSITLHIGVFPYFALSFCIFFFPADDIRRFFLRRKSPLTIEDYAVGVQHTYKNSLYYFAIPFIIIQFLLPLRHWVIPGDVLYTEEGHRLSWRMMLRSRSGEAKFLVVNKETGEKENFDNKLLLTKQQRRGLNKPDVIWQMAQKIKGYYADRGEEVSVYCRRSNVTINSKFYPALIDSAVDLAEEDWDYFAPSTWIMPQENKNKSNKIPSDD